MNVNYGQDAASSMVESHLAKVVKCFTRMTEILPHEGLYYRDTVKAIVVAGLNSDEESVRKDAKRARENLLHGGEFDLSDFEE